MTTVAEIRLWGRTIGAVALDTDASVARFEYDPDFIHSSIEVAPLTMPLSDRVYTFPELNLKTFHGLPGLVADSLPDKFGNAVIDAWLAREGRDAGSFNAVERLCYTGSRGMGALEFFPVSGPKAGKGKHLEVAALVRLASEVLSARKDFKTNWQEKPASEALHDILLVGTSAGGARAKAVIAWNAETNEVRSGNLDPEPGFKHWLLKFDGISGNKDKELEDPQGFGAIEYAYHLMATAAGITMSECRLFEENGRRHFMTRRFDRPDAGGKLHMQSLCALAHYDFNLAGAYSYEQAFGAIHRLALPAEARAEQFRRMVFNIMARNQDDHVKNIAFLMDKSGGWSLAPAFDLSYSYNPAGLWTRNHQMTMNGKRDNFILADFNRVAQQASLSRGTVRSVLEQVAAAIDRWPEFAAAARVDVAPGEEIERNLRLLDTFR